MKNNIAIVRVVETYVIGTPIKIVTAIIAIRSATGFMAEMKIAHPTQIHLIHRLQLIYPLDTNQPP